jgi:hypothetical protein
MGEPRVPDPVLLVMAIFSRHPAALDWGREQLERRFGPTALTSPLLQFNQTRYYERSMGPDLQKQFLAFQKLVDAGSLAGAKRTTNELEREIASSGRFPDARPLNVDPGRLTLGKFELATTKDQAHRVFVEEGIYAEVTLRFQDGSFTPWPWTYADYRQDAVLKFLVEARQWYRLQLRQSSNSAS